MSTPVKLGGFAALIVAVFALALGAGALIGPVGTASSSATAEDDADGGAHAGMDMGQEDGADESEGAEARLPGGIMVSQDGYTLALASRTLPAGTNVPLQFQVLDSDGAPVTEYETAHDKDLHLIAVRRDQSGYQHVHPELDDTGTWSAPLDLSAPGEYRVLADFVPAGRELNVVLGADLSVAGEYAPVALPAAATTAEVDGYTVTLEGTLGVGEESLLTLSVSKDGQPVTDLEPYLGSYGHLVALRQGDLAYLHVHPEGEPGDGTTTPGPQVGFYASAPSAAAYRLYFDFQHQGVVRTAEFTVVTDGAPSQSAGDHDSVPHDD